MRGRLWITAFGLALAAGQAAAVAGPALLFEAASGKVLYAEDADQQWHPASLTKIMTAYLAFEAIKTDQLKLEQKIPVSELAHIQSPSKIGLPVGAELTVDLALKALVIKSANDVAVMLAEAIDGSVEKFAERMNATAKRLGMARSNFKNPHGLPEPEQVTTARDLAKLAQAVARDFPEFASLWSMNDMLIGRRRLRTHNALLRTYDGADGMKTGFICDSGYNVVGSATRDGRRLMVVVLGEVSGHERAVRAASLLEHGFNTSGWKELFNTATLDNLPAAANRGPITIRETVASWECGNRRRRVPTKAQATRAKVAVIGKAQAKGRSAALSGQPAAGAQPANATAAPITKSKPAAKAAVP